MNAREMIALLEQLPGEALLLWGSPADDSSHVCFGPRDGTVVLVTRRERSHGVVQYSEVGGGRIPAVIFDVKNTDDCDAEARSQ